MNSMLRQNHIRTKDLSPCLKGYYPAKGEPAEEWAKAVAESFAPGMLMFCLDPIAALPGIKFGKKEPEAPEMYRVKDLCVMVGYNDGKPLVVNITNSAYELRFLEVLMLEKVRKAMLDGRDFLYVAAEPTKKLDQPQAQALEKLGISYAQGGSRRSVASEGAPQAEPALALFSALGADITLSGLSKNMLDIGSVCHMLFAPEGRQEDKNKTVLRSYFKIIASTETPKDHGQGDEPGTSAVSIQEILGGNQDQNQKTELMESSSELASVTEKETFKEGVSEESGFSVDSCSTDMSSPGQHAGALKPRESDSATELIFGPAPEAPQQFIQSIFMEEERSSDIESKQRGGSEGDDSCRSGSSEISCEAERLEKERRSSGSEAAGPQSLVEMSSYQEAGDSYKHLAEALSELIGKADRETTQATKEDISDTACGSEPTEWKAMDTMLPREHNQPLKRPAFSRDALLSVKEQSLADAPLVIPSGTPIESGGLLQLEPETTKPDDTEKAGSEPRPETTCQAPDAETMESSALESEAPHQFAQQSTSQKAVIHEMATLTRKLDQQVARAHNRLASKVEEAQRNLSMYVDSLVEEADRLEKERQDNITELVARLKRKLNDIAEEIQLKGSEAVLSGRHRIEELISGIRSQLDESKDSQCQSLQDALSELRVVIEALARATDSRLNELVEEGMQGVDRAVNAVYENLEEIRRAYVDKLNSRLDRFKERMSDEATYVKHSLEHNVQSMVKEIDGSLDRASEKLRSARDGFHEKICHSVKTVELQVAERIRQLLVTELIPRLRERKDILSEMSQEMVRRFSEESLSQVRAQLIRFESCIAQVQNDFEAFSHECLGGLDGVGRDQQAALEEIFSETNLYADRVCAEIQLVWQNAEKQMGKTDSLCRQLGENSSLDSDLKLSGELDVTKSKIRELKEKGYSEFISQIEQASGKLEKLSEESQNQLTGRRLKETQNLRQVVDNDLSRAREAIQEAFNAIASCREKQME